MGEDDVPIDANVPVDATECDGANTLIWRQFREVDADRTHLAAGNRKARRVFGETKCSL